MLQDVSSDQIVSALDKENWNVAKAMKFLTSIGKKERLRLAKEKRKEAQQKVEKEKKKAAADKEEEFLLRSVVAYRDIKNAIDNKVGRASVCVSRFKLM